MIYVQSYLDRADSSRSSAVTTGPDMEISQSCGAETGLCTVLLVLPLCLFRGWPKPYTDMVDPEPIKALMTWLNEVIACSG